VEPKTILFHVLALLPTVVFGYVTWRLIHHRERLAAIAPALVTIAAVFLHPLTQMAADSLIARPYAVHKKNAADAASLIGKDYATVIARLGKPSNVRASGPSVISTIATQEIKIVPGQEPYTALYYHAGSVFYLGTRFIVFLDAKGLVTGYRVKWEKSDADRNIPKRDTIAAQTVSDTN
jgi:hypothetical protein